MSTLSVIRLERFPDPAWNDYVVSHPAGRLFHLSDWGAVYRDLGWIEPRHLMALLDGDIVGVLPLGYVRWPLGGALISAPFCVEAGPLADSAQVRRALVAAAFEESQDLRVTMLELRQLEGADPAWRCHRQFASFRRTLADNADDNLSAVPRKQRAMIRKAQKAGLQVAHMPDLDTFYRLYATSMRNLGTPAYPRALFESLRERFGDRVSLLAVEDAEGVVAAVMNFWFDGCAMPYYAGALPRARAVHAADFMYWSVMQQAAGRGCREFDFGRSLVGSGAYGFKKNWGFEPRTLEYQYIDPRGGDAPPLDPDSPLNRVARRLWRRLPVAAATAVGGMVSRRLT
ncbi:MAG: FemAB family XrtA/PEP-CTERM system-associated protein [Gammaproteobacteria bacterium]